MGFPKSVLDRDMHGAAIRFLSSVRHNRLVIATTTATRLNFFFVKILDFNDKLDFMEAHLYQPNVKVVRAALKYMIKLLIELLVLITFGLKFCRIIPTFQKHDCGLMAGASNAIKTERFSDENFRRW